MHSNALAREGRFVWYVYLLESKTAEGERYIGVTLGPEATDRRAQRRKIQPYVQIPAVADRDLYRLLEPSQGDFIRALSQIRFRARFCEQTPLVNICGCSRDRAKIKDFPK